MYTLWKTYRKSSKQLLSNRRSLSFPIFTKDMKTYIRFKQHKNRLQNIKQVEPQLKYRFMADIGDPLAWSLWIPGARFAGYMEETSSHCCIQNINALGLVVPEKCVYVFPIV